MTQNRKVHKYSDAPCITLIIRFVVPYNHECVSGVSTFLKVNITFYHQKSLLRIKITFYAKIRSICDVFIIPQKIFRILLFNLNVTISRMCCSVFIYWLKKINNDVLVNKFRYVLFLLNKQLQQQYMYMLTMN